MDQPVQPNREGTPFKSMKTLQKSFWIFKVVVCVITFGIAFPNVMGD